MVVRQYNQELEYLERLTPYSWRIKKGFQPNMNVEGVFYVNDTLEKLMFEELRNACRPGMVGGFLPGMKQIANVAALPGIVGKSIGLPDVHSGYGFAIGNMAAFDMSNPDSIVSPGLRTQQTFSFNLKTVLPFQVEWVSISTAVFVY